jgi:alpha-L-rhamnosidase
MGDDGTGGMVSFNHYAFGAVGDFFYRRIAGIEAVDGGYKRFRIQPVTNELSYASANVQSPYGEIQSSWEKKDGVFTLRVKVPVSTTCSVVMPSGKAYEVENGVYEFKE